LDQKSNTYKNGLDLDSTWSSSRFCVCGLRLKPAAVLVKSWLSTQQTL